MISHTRLALALTLPFALAACGDDEATSAPFSLRFAAVASGQQVGCGDTLTGLGVNGSGTAELADLRFYVSNLHAYDAKGAEVALTIDTNDFQYTSAAGQVSLIDLTSTAEGACAPEGIAFAEGTARTNDVITGSAKLDAVTRLTFDVGVPQAVMRDVIANSTAEGAPSPLAEMYWSWQSGYRHFVMNMAVSDSGTPGEAYVHLGSRDCGAGGAKALTDRAACTYVNTPSVDLAVSGLRDQVVTVDIPAILANAGFIAPVMNADMQVIGETVGVACHSGPMQADCAAIFPRFGVDLATGTADPSGDLVFGVQ